MRRMGCLGVGVPGSFVGVVLRWRLVVVHTCSRPSWEVGHVARGVLAALGVGEDESLAPAVELA